MFFSKYTNRTAAAPVSLFLYSSALECLRPQKKHPPVCRAYSTHQARDRSASKRVRCAEKKSSLYGFPNKASRPACADDMVMENGRDLVEMVCSAFNDNDEYEYGGFAAFGKGNIYQLNHINHIVHAGNFHVALLMHEGRTVSAAAFRCVQSKIVKYVCVCDTDSSAAALQVLWQQLC